MFYGPHSSSLKQNKGRTSLPLSELNRLVRYRQAAFACMTHIIAIPPQHIIIGMPLFAMFIMFWQHCMNMSFIDASMGFISQVMPLAVIVQVIWHIMVGIDIMPPIGIMPFIIMGDIIGEVPPIMGIIICIAGVMCLSLQEVNDL